MEPSQLSPVGKTVLNRTEFDENEKLHLEVRKHPIGLFMIYLAGALSILAVFGLMVIGAAAFDFTSVGEDVGITGGSLQAIIIAVGFFLTVFAVIITAVAAFIYTHNVLIVTSEKIVQQLYLSLFNKKISQLSIADVQDSTVRQQGIIAHIFNYGTVTIETAGEQSNYTFTFVPNPYEVSKALVGAHEADAALHGN
jgi:hypothetical protein